MKKGCVWLSVLLLLAVCVAAASQESELALIKRRVKCTLIQFPFCFLISLFCPPECPSSCFMDCTICRPVCTCSRPGAVCQDPRFIGGDGITFYYHGKRDRDFCLVTDPNLHINAHFIGKRNPTMKRDFTWVQSLGLLFDQHKLLVGAKKTATWHDATDRLELAFDGEPISLPPNEGATWHSDAATNVSITRTRATNGVTVEAGGKFAISATVVPITEKDSRVHGYNITSDDCFAHLDLGFKFYDLSDGVHGVLGQTYRKNYTSRVKIGAAMPVMGGDREFSSSNLFATDCASSRFTGTAVSGGGAERESLQCNVGAGGGGVVCKR